MMYINAVVENWHDVSKPSIRVSIPTTQDDLDLALNQIDEETLGIAFTGKVSLDAKPTGKIIKSKNDIATRARF